MSAIRSLGSESSYYGYQALSGTQGRMPHKTETEEQRAQKFSKADASQDGTLDISEFEELISNAPKNGGGTTSVDEMFANADSNSDGALTQEELDANMQKMHGGLESQGNRIKEMLSLFDTDGDGTLSETEIDEIASSLESVMQNDKSGDANKGSSMIGQMPPPPPPPRNENSGETDTGEIFSSIDANGDGTISSEEFSAYVEQKKLDAESNTAATEDGIATATTTTEASASTEETGTSATASASEETLATTSSSGSTSAGTTSSSGDQSDIKNLSTELSKLIAKYLSNFSNQYRANDTLLSLSA